MKYILATLIMLGCVSAIFAQDTISLQQVKSRIGDSITVCGRIDDTRYLVTADNSPTFLNIGGSYPKQLLTVVIWGDIREKLKGKPELDFKNKSVCVSGKIEFYKASPQIVIHNVEQLKLQPD